MAGVHKSKAAAILLCFSVLFLSEIFGWEDYRPPGVSAAQSDPVPNYTVKILQRYPHDPQAFTEGLVFAKGFLFESTGINGNSSLRRVELETGRVAQKIDLPSKYFGEGLTLWKNVLIQLTWKSGKGFVYNQRDFSIEREFRYSTEGWGLTHDGESLIMSNGSNRLIFLDPETFEKRKELPVLSGGKPVQLLNELEYIKGEIFANIWFKDFVARISPKTGLVTGWIDMSSLRGALPPASRAEALNGIAYDEEKDRIFVTGKLWPYVFQVQIVEAVKSKDKE